MLSLSIQYRYIGGLNFRQLGTTTATESDAVPIDDLPLSLTQAVLRSRERRISGLTHDKADLHSACSSASKPTMPALVSSESAKLVVQQASAERRVVEVRRRPLPGLQQQQQQQQSASEVCVKQRGRHTGAPSLGAAANCGDGPRSKLLGL